LKRGHISYYLFYPAQFAVSSIYVCKAYIGPYGAI